MKHSEQLEQLTTSLVAALGEIAAVEFDSTNPFLKNKYASLGAVLRASKPILAKHNLGIVQFAISGSGQTSAQALPDPLPDAGDIVPLSTSRAGTLDIGIETVIVHASGQWMSGEMLIPLSKEKGKSTAQMAGSVITYLRRYCWAAALGMYADEDTDGGGRHEEGDGGGFESGTSKKPAGAAGGSQGTTRAAKPASTPTPDPRIALIADLHKKMGAGEPEFIRYLRERKNDKGQVALIGTSLEQLSTPWLRFLCENWAVQSRAIATWIADNPRLPQEPTQPQAQETAGAEQAERDIQRGVDPDGDPGPENPERWRDYPMPYGEHKGIPLGKLDQTKLGKDARKYLFGLWANYTVEETYRGRALTEEQIAANREFREILDLCGAHYEFTKNR